MISNSGPSARIVLYQSVELAPGRYKVRLAGSIDGPPASAKVIASPGCGGHFPLAIQPDGNALGEGQSIVVTDCGTQQLGLWLTGNNSTVRLRSIELAAGD